MSHMNSHSKLNGSTEWLYEANSWPRSGSFQKAISHIPSLRIDKPLKPTQFKTTANGFELGWKYQKGYNLAIFANIKIKFDMVEAHSNSQHIKIFHIT